MRKRTWIAVAVAVVALLLVGVPALARGPAMGSGRTSALTQIGGDYGGSHCPMMDGGMMDDMTDGGMMGGYGPGGGTGSNQGYGSGFGPGGMMGGGMMGGYGAGARGMMGGGPTGRCMMVGW